jgi:hypothetical protein
MSWQAMNSSAMASTHSMSVHRFADAMAPSFSRVAGLILTGLFGIATMGIRGRIPRVIGMSTHSTQDF